MFVSCTKCKAPLPGHIFRAGDNGQCPSCNVQIAADAYPALKLLPGSTSAGTAPVMDDQAGCYFHPNRLAETICESCGRFICSLCRLDLRETPICPSCLESGMEKESFNTLIGKRYLWDRFAWHLAIIPAIIFPLWIITAPATMYICIRRWNSATSLTGRTKIRYIAAFLFAVIELIVWFMWIWGL